MNPDCSIKSPGPGDTLYPNATVKPDGQVVGPDGKAIGKVRADGTVVGPDGTIVGQLAPDGSIKGPGPKVPVGPGDVQRPDEFADPLIGRVIADRYRIVELLGRGGGNGHDCGLTVVRLLHLHRRRHGQLRPTFQQQYRPATRFWPRKQRYRQRLRQSW